MSIIRITSLVGGLLVVLTGAPTGHAQDRPGPRVVGDTCSAALPIVLDPNGYFTITGNTCGFSDDYDEACPWAGSGAPDIVYRLTPPYDMFIDVLLCESALDTKLYVYDSNCPDTLAGCNDDDCGPALRQSQLLSLQVLATNTYYIVVDGNGDDCGAYELTILPGAPIPICPPHAVFSQPVDLANGGGATSDQAAAIQSYAYVSGIVGPVRDLRWWGINRVYAGLWLTCDKTDPNLSLPQERFVITAYADDDGLPGERVYGPHTVKPTRELTGYAIDNAPLLEYRTQIPPCTFPDGEGWLSIHGIDDGQDCWFLWVHRPGGPAEFHALQQDLPSGQVIARDYDLCFCLAEPADPNVRGACCYVDGDCYDDLAGADCAGPFARFESDTLCAEMEPPCIEATGACCYDDWTCRERTYTECMTNPGDVSCDNQLTFGDINPFVDAMLCSSKPDPQACWDALYPDCDYMRADCNRDGAVDFGDINAFVYLMLDGVTDWNWLGPGTTCADCPCSVPCPPEATPEAEPCGDDTNGGCSSTPEAFEILDCDTIICGTVEKTAGRTDIDQYEIVVSEHTRLTLTVKAEFAVHFGFLEQTVPGQPGCANWTGAFAPDLMRPRCATDSVSICAPPGTHYAFVRPQVDAGTLDCPTRYLLSLSCEPCRACCLPNGSCLPDTTLAECDALGGQWQPDGVSCEPDNPCPQPPLGAHCLRPLVVTLEPNDPPFVDPNTTTCGRLDDYENTCLGEFDSGEEIIYELHLPGLTGVVITLDPRGTPLTGMVLDDQCPPDPSDCLALATDASGLGQPYSIDCTAIDPGNGPYYLMIDTSAPPTCIPSFDLTIEECDGCSVPCPDPNGPFEGEQTCHDNYVDTFNAGCDSTPPSFVPILCGQTICGDSGTFVVADPNNLDPNGLPVETPQRDADWYELTVGEATLFLWSVEAEFAATILILDATAGDCNDPIELASGSASRCDPDGVTAGCLSAGTYWLAVLPQAWTGVPCGARYTVSLTCMPCGAYCAATSERCVEHIGNVTVGSINNESNCTYYADYTALYTTMAAGSSLPISVNVEDYFHSDIVNVWVDWNADGSFDETAIPLAHGGGGVFTGQFDVPPGASVGPTRMRVRLEYNTTVGPCGASSFGEVEDYTIVVVE